MADELNFTQEIEKIQNYYNNDPLQKRFSLLLLGDTGAGKTFSLRTARKPVLVDSFDQGGTKCLEDYIKTGEVVADTRWENENPYKPQVFQKWMKETDWRLKNNFYAGFGTYVIDSATKWAKTIMNFQLNVESIPGQRPRYNKDYTPQRIYMENYLDALMNIPCDFIMTGHLSMIEEKTGIQDERGRDVVKIIYRFMSTGQSTVIIPLSFDEMYVAVAEERQRESERYFLTNSQGKYLARSRLCKDGLINKREPQDIMAILRKAGVEGKEE